LCDSIHKDLARAKALIDENKYNQALQMINDLENNEDLTVHDPILSKLLKSTILNRLAQYQDAFTLAEEVYQETERLGYDLQSLDASIEMAESLMYLGRLDKALEMVTNNEGRLKIITQVSSKELAHREASIAFIKGLVYAEQNNLDKGIKYTEQSLLLRRKLGNQLEIARSLTQMGFILFLDGEYDLMLKYLEESLKLEDGIFNRNILVTFTCFGHINVKRGNIDRALEYYKQSYNLAKEMNANDIMAWNLLSFGIICRNQGNLDNALEYLKRSLVLYDEIGHNFMISAVLDELLVLYLGMNSFEQANYYLDRLKQLTDRDNNKFIKNVYLINKAGVLKSSLRARDRVKAEEILKQVLGEEGIDHETNIGALLHICDLLLIELRSSNDLEVLDEIQPYINQLLDNAEHQSSYKLLAETYLLQAKLSLITLDIKKARRFLTQAQQIAERFGLSRLTTMISNEHNKLLKQSNLWEKLKESNAPLTERMELAQISEQMDQMMRNRSALTTKITEESVSIHKERKICIVCKGEITGFMFVCSCDTIYCEHCAKALANLENVCWACDAPMDKTKPVKHYEEEEISDVTQKKLK